MELGKVTIWLAMESARTAPTWRTIVDEIWSTIIFEDDFLGLVARFQRNLFRAGLLPIFQLDITMA